VAFEQHGVRLPSACSGGQVDPQSPTTVWAGITPRDSFLRKGGSRFLVFIAQMIACEERFWIGALGVTMAFFGCILAHCLLT
jgi:hypothetical protein